MKISNYLTLNRNYCNSFVLKLDTLTDYTIYENTDELCYYIEKY